MGLFGVSKAPRQPGGDELEAGLLQRADHRGQLRDDLPAVATVGQHRLDAADLPFGSPQALLEIVQRFVREFHAPSIPQGVQPAGGGGGERA